MSLASALAARRARASQPTPETASTSADAHELIESYRVGRPREAGAPASVEAPALGSAVPSPVAGEPPPATLPPLDLGRPLRGCPVAVIDVETTGIDPAEARVVEVAVVIIDALGETEPYVALSTRVNPGSPIPPDATKVHGISDADVADAPTWAVVQAQIAELTRGRLPVAYNAAYDAQVLHAEVARLAATDTGANPVPHLRWGAWADPFILARLVDQFERGKRLADVAARRAIRVDAHGAAGDAVTTALLLPTLLGEAARLVRRGRPVDGRPSGQDLATVGAFVTWQRRAALAQEREFAEFKRGESVDCPWHELEGLEPPAPQERETATTACRSCGAAIVWHVTKDGHRIPLDPEIRTGAYDAAAGSQAVTLVLADGRVTRLFVPREDWTGQVERGRVSHFATCPQAGQHRRRA